MIPRFYEINKYYLNKSTFLGKQTGSRLSLGMCVWVALWMDVDCFVPCLCVHVYLKQVEDSSCLICEEKCRIPREAMCCKIHESYIYPYFSEKSKWSV